MDSVNKTLYIPLYGKAFVSKKGLFLEDKKAEQIWEAEGFPLKGKSASKWLAYYMGIRSAVYDRWVRQQLSQDPEAAVLHIGCGMDSRVLRVGANCKWYDIDFPEVIAERKRYYEESHRYKMLPGDAREDSWLARIPETGKAIVVMEGISMYLKPAETQALLASLADHFESVSLLMDCYTEMAAKITRYKNPINDVGVTEVYGIDDPLVFQQDGFVFVNEHNMTPEAYIQELAGMEKAVFRKLYAGHFAKKLYRMFEYRR